MLKAGAVELSACGLSKRKTEYILDLADHFKAKRVHANQWAEMADEAVIAELIGPFSRQLEQLAEIPGIGRIGEAHRIGQCLVVGAVEGDGLELAGTLDGELKIVQVISENEQPKFLGVMRARGSA